MIDFNKRNHAGSELTDDEMLSNLKGLMASADNKYRNFNTTRIVGKQNVKKEKIELMNQLFDLLESNNIDPSSKEELNAFMEELKAYSPEIFSKFESALADLVADPDIQESPREVSQGLM